MTNRASALLAEPVKMRIINLDDPSIFIEPEYNPTELREKLAANWAKVTIPGMSHRRRQYIDTDNNSFSFTLHYDSTDRTPDEHNLFLVQRSFLLAHCYARRGATTITDGAPPRVIFVWPGLARMVSIIEDLDFVYLKFNRLLEPTLWEVTIQLSEIRDRRLFFDDVLLNGTFRGSSF